MPRGKVHAHEWQQGHMHVSHISHILMVRYEGGLHACPCPPHLHMCMHVSITAPYSHVSLSLPFSLVCSYCIRDAPKSFWACFQQQQARKCFGPLAPAAPDSSLQGLHVGVPLARFGLLVREIQGFKVRGSFLLLEVDGGVWGLNGGGGSGVCGLASCQHASHDEVCLGFKRV